MSDDDYDVTTEQGTGHKKVAILIAVLAALLALMETGAKSGQTAFISHTLEVSDSWSFYQAKTIRRTVLATAAEQLQLEKDGNPALTESQRGAIDKQLSAWRSTMSRWESEPSTGEGQRELTLRAQDQEKQREAAERRYEKFELGAAAVQIAIVLASASIITGIAQVAWAAALLGSVGGLFGLVAWLMPGLF